MTTTPYDWKRQAVSEHEKVYERFVLAAWKQDEEPVEVMFRLLTEYADLHDPQPIGRLV